MSTLMIPSLLGAKPIVWHLALDTQGTINVTMHRPPDMIRCGGVVSVEVSSLYNGIDVNVYLYMTDGSCIHLEKRSRFLVERLTDLIGQAQTASGKSNSPMFLIDGSLKTVIGHDLGRLIPETASAVGQAMTEKPSCGECYGTGYHKGFGAPCSKGCSS